MKIRCYKVNGKVEELTCTEFCKFFNNKRNAKLEWEKCIINTKKQPENSDGSRIYKYIHNKHTFFFTHKIPKEYFSIKSDHKQSEIPVIQTQYATDIVKWNESLKCFTQGKYPAKELLDGELGNCILRYLKISKSNKKFVNLDGDLINICSQRLRLFKVKGIKCVDCGCEGKWFYKCKFKDEDSYHLELVTEDDVRLTKDHILPASKDGADNLQNYQVMCEKCNKSKGDKLNYKDKCNGVSKNDLCRLKLEEVKSICRKYKNSKISKNDLIKKIEEAASSDTLVKIPKKSGLFNRFWGWIIQKIENSRIIK